MLLCDTVPQLEEEILGLVETDGELEIVEVRQPDTEGNVVDDKDTELQLEIVPDNDPLGVILVEGDTLREPELQYVLMTDVLGAGEREGKRVDDTVKVTDTVGVLATLVLTLGEVVPVRHRVGEID